MAPAVRVQIVADKAMISPRTSTERRLPAVEATRCGRRGYARWRLGVGARLGGDAKSFELAPNVTI